MSSRNVQTFRWTIMKWAGEQLLVPHVPTYAGFFFSNGYLMDIHILWDLLCTLLWVQVGDEHLRKQHRVLADLHYSKAVRLFQLLKDAPCEFLRVQLERVAFAEFQMASKSSSVLLQQLSKVPLSI